MPPVCDQKKWADFLKSSGLESVRLYDYYLGKRAVKNFAVEDCGKVVVELFQDAVEVGAIELPGGLSPADFQLEVKAPLGAGGRRSKIIVVSCKPPSGVETQETIYYGLGYRTMAHRTVRAFLIRITRAIDSMLTEERRRQKLNRKP
jgi:hypothetical protein